jgi:wyosine [tRNA(Phe)-imidazoG37] synthetase (radical SAM superfamily)
MSTEIINEFSAVYGPVKSWRYGQSLGVDLLGKISTCSFNCVYCQLGEIERKTQERKIYLETEKIIQDINKYLPFKDIDIITFSGSGEPTLALNLGEVLTYLKKMTNLPVLVLTNGTKLGDRTVRKELRLADKISIKLDGIGVEQLRKINRPVTEVSVTEIKENSKQFRQEYQNKISIQTMILSPWTEKTIEEYAAIIKHIQPDDIQLNTPTRPKPLKHELDARGNHTPTNTRSYPVKIFKCIDLDLLENIARQIYELTKIPLTYNHQNLAC